MKYALHLDGREENGGTSLVCHNERLVDPLDPFVQEIAKLSKKRSKSLDDHQEIARLEFFGGLYTDPPLEYPLTGPAATVVIPSWNILRCLQDGGKRHKRGMDVPRGVHPLTEHVPIQYDGPDSPEELWKDGGFALRKSVGVQRSRTMRTRPIFSNWQAELEVEVDTTILDRHILTTIWQEAGVYSGLGEMRPIYGRFTATLEQVG